MEQIKKEHKALGKIVTDLDKTNQNIEEFLRTPEYISLLADVPLPSSPFTDWANAAYPTNSKHPEHLIHQTVGGLKVRSKSESLIALSLSQHGIPFRYECLLEIENYPIYPDFTILHPISSTPFYWEHFGMMDNPAYATDAFHKLQTYCSHGIIPGQNLITTFETSDFPLNYDTIEKSISTFLL